MSKVSVSHYIPRKSTSNNPIVTKGATEALKIDKDEIERILTSLENDRDVIANQLTGQKAAYLKLITDYAKKFHGTSSYRDFYDQILKHFAGGQKIFPRSVAAVLVGNYYYKGDLPSKVYAPTCIDSIPTPDDEYLPPCDRNVILVYRDESYCKSVASNLTNLNVTTKDIVVLMGDINPETAKLYQSELELLSAMDVTSYDFYIYINGYYKAIRPLGMVRKHKHYERVQNSSSALPIVATIAVLLIIFVILLTPKHK